MPTINFNVNNEGVRKIEFILKIQSKIDEIIFFESNI